MTDGSRRQVYCGSDEPTCITTPGTTTGKRALETAADRMSITARDEAAACIKDILECSAADADLQHTAVKATFKVEVVTESQLG